MDSSPKKSDQINQISHLPSDLVFTIACFLSSPSELINYGLICKRFYSLTLYQCARVIQSGRNNQNGNNAPKQAAWGPRPWIIQKIIQDHQGKHHNNQRNNSNKSKTHDSYVAQKLFKQFSVPFLCFQTSDPSNELILISVMMSRQLPNKQLHGKYIAWKLKDEHENLAGYNLFKEAVGGVWDASETQTVMDEAVQMKIKAVLHNIGFLMLEGKLINGRREGVFQSFYSNGQVSDWLDGYHHQKKEGQQITFAEDGKIRAIYHYRNDKLDGDFILYENYQTQQGYYHNGRLWGEQSTKSRVTWNGTLADEDKDENCLEYLSARSIYINGFTVKQECWDQDGVRREMQIFFPEQVRKSTFSSATHRMWDAQGIIYQQQYHQPPALSSHSQSPVVNSEFNSQNREYKLWYEDGSLNVYRFDEAGALLGTHEEFHVIAGEAGRHHRFLAGRYHYSTSGALLMTETWSPNGVRVAVAQLREITNWDADGIEIRRLRINTPDANRSTLSSCILS